MKNITLADIEEAKKEASSQIRIGMSIVAVINPDGYAVKLNDGKGLWIDQKDHWTDEQLLKYCADQGLTKDLICPA